MENQTNLTITIRGTVVMSDGEVHVLDETQTGLKGLIVDAMLDSDDGMTMKAIYGGISVMTIAGFMSYLRKTLGEKMYKAAVIMAEIGDVEEAAGDE